MLETEKNYEEIKLIIGKILKQKDIEEDAHNKREGGM